MANERTLNNLTNDYFESMKQSDMALKNGYPNSSAEYKKRALKTALKYRDLKGIEHLDAAVADMRARRQRTER